METWRRTLGKLPSESIRESELALRALGLNEEAEKFVDLRLSVEEFEGFMAENLPDAQKRIKELEEELSATKEDLCDAEEALSTVKEDLREAEEKMEATLHESPTQKEPETLEARVSRLESLVSSLRK